MLGTDNERIAALAPRDTPFVYIDSAVGGARNRNHVMRLDDFRPPENASDCFTTFLRFPEDLFSYARSNASPSTGRPPSVAGYPGTALACFVPVNLD